MPSRSLSPTSPAPARGPTAVLVVDDDADMRLYLTGCLRSFGEATLTVTEATDGRDALLLARALLPGLIISDMVMPGLDGVALCLALKADPKTQAIPFLLVSGETRAPPPCADGFLAKPFNATSLREQVERLLPG